MHRHVIPVPLADFDTRATILDQEIRSDWKADVKRLHRENYESVMAGLAIELGPVNFTEKLNRFREIGSSPLSIISYHNQFFRQIRNSYVQGAFYPALTGACSLGERMLNHLVLDLRDEFRGTKQYEKVKDLTFIKSWQIAINVLKEWSVILPEAESDFRKLATLRQRSIHFNPQTYETIESDSLKAVKLVASVVDWQFSAFGLRPWFIEGSKGTCFIKKDYEDNPFIRRFYLPLCPRVGVNFQYSNDHGIWRLFDFKDYPDQEISDEEFCESFNSRNPSEIAPNEFPPTDDRVVCYEFRL